MKVTTLSKGDLFCTELWIIPLSSLEMELENLLYK